MRRFADGFLVCLALLAVRAEARPGEPAAETPAIVVRVKSLDALLQNLNLVVKLIGQEQAALDIEGAIRGKIGKKGLEGIDPARPFGAYARFGKTLDETHGAILIPCADEKAFLILVENLEIPFVKDKSGIYTHKTENLDIHFRFAHKYVFVTTGSAASLQDKCLLDPAKALAVTGDATISAVIQVDRIPVSAKEVALKHMNEAIESAEKIATPGESKVQAAFRIALLRDAQKLGHTLLNDAGELRLDVHLNEKASELFVNFSLAGKPNSKLAKTIKNIGDLKSPLAGLVKKEVAFLGNVHFVLPEELNKALSDVIDEVRLKSLEGIQDPEKKKRAAELFKALMPTATAGEHQLSAAAVGPKNERYTFIGAIKLKEGKTLGVTVGLRLLEALKDIPEEQRVKIQLNFDSAAGIPIHKFELPKNVDLDKILMDIAGDRHLLVAFRDDALFLALGVDALPVMKAAIAVKDPAPSVPFLFDFDVARMAKLMARTQKQQDLADELFPAGKTGRVRLAVEGGDTLSVRLRLELNVLEFLVKMANK